MIYEFYVKYMFNIKKYVNIICTLKFKKKGETNEK